MSPERSKVILITVAVAAFVLVVSIAGIFLFYPKNQAGSAPATIGNTAVPKAADPQDYLNAPPSPPDARQPTRNNGDIVVIYGDKPSNLPPLGGMTGGTPAGSAPGASSPGDGATGFAPPPPSSSNVTASATGQASATATATATATLAPPVAVAPGKASAGQTKAIAKQPAKIAPTPAAAKKPASTAEFWIQAASFTERGKADSLREGLSAKGIAALITVKDINGKSWYRVRIGPYSAKKEAEGWLGRVKTVSGCGEAFVSSQAPGKP